MQKDHENITGLHILLNDALKETTSSILGNLKPISCGEIKLYVLDSVRVRIVANLPPLLHTPTCITYWKAALHTAKSSPVNWRVRPMKDNLHAFEFTSYNPDQEIEIT